MSLTLQQILSNCAWGFARFSYKSCPERISFLPNFLLCPDIKEKSDGISASIKKRRPEFSGRRFSRV
jgi:hypothetical protein